MSEKNQILVVGAQSTGKSSIIGKLDKGFFKECNFAPTLGLVPYPLTLQIDEKSHKVLIYDSQGFDCNPGIMSVPQFKSYTAFIIVLDITDRNSFNNAKQCVDEIRKLCLIENQYVIALGNKDDLEEQRQVPIKEAMKYFDSQGIQYMEVSAKQTTQEQFKKIFSEKLKLLLAQRIADNPGLNKSDDRVILSKKEQKGGCC